MSLACSGRMFFILMPDIIDPLSVHQPRGFIGKDLRQHARRNVPAEGRSLPGPQRREISGAVLLCMRAQRRQRFGGAGKFWNERADWSDFTDDTVDDAA